MGEHRSILIFAEQEDGEIHQVSYELLGKGRELADRLGVELNAVLLGWQMESKSSELIYRGADNVFLYDHPSLRDFDVIRYGRNIVKLVRETRPEIFLIGATRIGRTLAPRIAAALKTGLTADCIDLALDEDANLIQIRPAFSGNIMAQIRTKTRPQMATVRYRVMRMRERDTDRRGKIIKMKVEVIEETGMKIIEKIRADEVNLADAEVIVSGGRGLRRPEDFKLLQELAEALGGVVGSSRPLVDAGWISKDHQVGFSGNTVKPKVYIACGISGSPQHLFGMRDSDVIIAINKDPTAPIFNVSDYGVIGDLYEVIPLLIREIKNKARRGGKSDGKAGGDD
ncbi:electron transfer flavoprotein subunit alpha/FixB family protein [Candidatus Bathyarchaeota archaeon]|nr:MAG: electron transfer flavoprotein subunit alpha/FixB family protein [Candidatus Bathyarchaeota archaeon]